MDVLISKLGVNNIIVTPQNKNKIIVVSDLVQREYSRSALKQKRQGFTKTNSQFFFLQNTVGDCFGRFDDDYDCWGLGFVLANVANRFAGDR